MNSHKQKLQEAFNISQERKDTTTGVQNIPLKHISILEDQDLAIQNRNIRTQDQELSKNLNLQHRKKLERFLLINNKKLTEQNKNLIRKLIKSKEIFKSIYKDIYIESLKKSSKDRKDQQLLMSLYNTLNLNDIPPFQKKLIFYLEKYQTKWFRNKDKKRHINLLIETLKKTDYTNDKLVLYKNILLARNTMRNATPKKVKSSEFIKTINRCIFELLPPDKKKIIQKLESYKNKFFVKTSEKSSVTQLMDSLMRVPLNEPWTELLTQAQLKINPIDRFFSILTDSIKIFSKNKDYQEEVKEIFSTFPQKKRTFALFSRDDQDIQYTARRLLYLSTDAFHMLNLNELDSIKLKLKPSFVNNANFFNELSYQVVLTILQSTNKNEWKIKTLQFIKLSKECLKQGDLFTAAAICAGLNSVYIYNKETKSELELLVEELSKIQEKCRKLSSETAIKQSSVIIPLVNDFQGALDKKNNIIQKVPEKTPFDQVEIRETLDRFDLKSILGSYMKKTQRKYDITLSHKTTEYHLKSEYASSFISKVKTQERLIKNKQKKRIQP